MPPPLSLPIVLVFAERVEKVVVPELPPPVLQLPASRVLSGEPLPTHLLFPPVHIFV